MHPESKKYTMRISRLTIDKLGIQMYDRVSAVLAELIANAYDEDAENVSITLPFGEYLARRREGQVEDQGFEIVIEDDGSGMTAQEVNDYYLNVGYNRRVNRTGGDVSPKHNRRVMGRKGIGKLAPFGICHEVEVVSAGGEQTDQGYPVSNLILDLNRILDEQLDEDGNVLPYHPQPGQRDETFAETTGTKLILRRFDRRRVPTGEELDRQLAARFGLSRPDWKVNISDSLGKSLSIELGTLEVDVIEQTRIDVAKRPVKLSDDQYRSVSGWVAYAKDPYKDEVMAGVRIYARGKIVAQTRDFDIKTGFTGEFKMRSYLTGAIHADWLDEGEDLIRTDRQDIIWNSDVGNALREWGRELLKDLARNADTSVQQRLWDLFLEKSQLVQRLDNSPLKDATVRSSVLRAARALVTKADRDSIASEDGEYRQRVIDLAYAVGPYRTLLDTLDEITVADSTSTDTILELFARASIVEIYALGQVAQKRVLSVEQLKRLISDPKTVERQLQELIEGAQWILYPDWTPLSQNEPLARTRQNFENWYRLKHGKEIVTSSMGSPRKEPDFVMLNHEGRMEVVEIKRPGHKLTNGEFDTAMEYLGAVRDFIADTQEVRELFRDARLTIVCDALNLNASREEPINTSPNVNHKTWHDVLQATTRSHEDFLAEVRKLQGALPNAIMEDAS